MFDGLNLSEDGAGVMIDVWAVPGAKRSEVVGVHDGALRVRLAAPAAEGSANRELLKLLTRTFGARATLLKGAGSRRKRIRIEGRSAGQVAETLELTGGNQG